MRVQQVEGPAQGIPLALQPPGGSTQTPAVPSFLVQTLLQHSTSLKHRSPLAWHPEAEAHLPALQFVEQHSVPEAQACPRTLHPPVEAQVPLEQTPVQHVLALVEQGPPTSVHCVAQV